MDDLDLPDNDDQGGSGLIDSLFGDQSRPRPKRDGSAGNRRPTVRFTEPTRSTTPTIAPQNTQPSRLSTEASSSTSGLFDDLFGSSSTVADSSTTSRPRSQQQSRRGTATSGVEQEILGTTQSAPPIQQPPAQSNVELEQLRRETSNLRFERNEMQQTISDMTKSQITLVENHDKVLRKLRNEHHEELERLKKEHAEEVSKLRNSIEDDVDVVRNVKRQEDQLVSVQSRLENLTYTLNGLRDSITSMGNYNESVNKIVDLADQQISQGMSTLHTEINTWEHRRQSLLNSLEQEINQLTHKYSEEIVQGRKWIESERDHLRAEQQAFQEEQTVILTQIEQKKAELEQYRTEFITKEHDLLVRVVNERAQLDEQKREFQRQRNADIMRMREEAEHLERCLQQVEQSHQALERTRKELEEKHRDLDDLHAQLVQHETNYWRSNQGIP